MIINAGSTDVSVYVYIVEDAGSTNPGEPITGLLFSDIETGGSASYMRQGAARTDFTLVTQTPAGAHTDGGFVEVDSTNIPGVYRVDVPDAAFTAGVNQTIIQVIPAAANNALVSPVLVDIMQTVPQVTTVNGIATDVITASSIQNNAITAAKIATDAITAAKIAADAIDASALAADAITEIRDAIHPVPNTTLDNIPFVFKDSTGNYVTSASGISITRSIDGAAFTAVSGTTVAEVGNGLYEIDASAADMNGGKITFRITATGGTPGAPVDRFVTIVTGSGN